MSDGGGKHKVFGPYWDDVNSVMHEDIYIYAFVTGATWGTGKNFWSNEDKSSALQSLQGDGTGTVDGYFDDTLYDIEIRKSDNVTVIKRYTNVRFTGDAHILSNDTSYPSVTSLNDHQLAVKRTAGGIIQELGISDGTEFRRLISVNDVVTKTAAYTVALNVGTVLGDATAAPFTITLPTAAGIKGKSILFKKTDSSANAITIDGENTETIDGDLTKTLDDQYDALLVESDGVNWEISSTITAGVKPTFHVKLAGSGQTNITSIDKIEFDTETFDTNSNYDKDTNFRFTPTVAGKYVLTAGISWEALTAGDLLTLYIYKNGSSYQQAAIRAQGITDGQTLTTVVDANGSTDYFEVFAQNGQRDTSDIGAEAAATWFAGGKID